MNPSYRRLLIIGYGGVSQCALPLIINFYLLKKKITSIIIVDAFDIQSKLQPYLDQYNQIKFHQVLIDKDNFEEIFENYLSSNDIILDLGFKLDTRCELKWCNDHNVCFVNTSIELWDTLYHKHPSDPYLSTLHCRHKGLIDMLNDKTWKKNGATSIVDHGCNPGLVSHFVKRALIDMTEYILTKCSTSILEDKRIEFEEALKEKNYPKLAYLIGIKTIHISERDTQITNVPKKLNEFVNTWSVGGFVEEALASTEIGWGTHERNIPEGMLFFDEKQEPNNLVCYPRKGMDTLVRSWVPSGEIIGMVVQHSEAYGISKSLTIHKDDGNNNSIIYRPTVHFAYLPSDSAMNSLFEYRMNNYKLQPKIRLLNDDIIDGAEEVGVLLLGSPYVRAWWTGSVLNIHEARRLAPGKNATTLQVAIGAVAAVNYCINHPNEGYCLPDDIDAHEILDICMPYLGNWISKAVEWPPINDKITKDWQFTSFLVVD
ncbi:unnamed protein product [Rotaria sp. Silwood2]|nr:unnamed protein product [Rotaria sp. Silwood2]CAF2940890.1 unnamed protein product [Rotaria sp. Silwood2]CAF3188781.1 unnamed protein product [Rotaria sp. Silwood2]CAF3327512.1 unnamed protein product [Rotaria sp. Silwood2]CAF3939879.1 unnamed protein product [Rotaria sp. Silwood2]